MSMGRDDEPTRIGAGLLEYAQLYPSLPERIRRITSSADPVLSAKMQALIMAYQRAHELQLQRILQRFGLTPTEARIAQFLGDGGSISQYAEAFSVSEGTVRVHLKSIFAKTGVHRQAELVRLIGSANAAG